MQEQNTIPLDEVSSVDVLIQGINICVVDDSTQETTTIYFPKFNVCYDHTIPRENISQYVTAQYKEHKKAQKLLNNTLIQSYEELQQQINQEKTREQAASMLSEQKLNAATRVVRARKGLFSFFSNQTFEERYNTMTTLAQQERYGCEKIHHAISHGTECIGLLVKRFAQDDNTKDKLINWGVVQQDLKFVTKQLYETAGKKLELLEREREFYCPQETSFLA